MSIVRAATQMVGRRQSSSVAFIGLGNMGLPMVKNLSKRTKPIRAYDINQAAIIKNDEALTSTTTTTTAIQFCGSIKEAVTTASTVITMLPNDEAVRQVYVADGGILENAPKDCLLIDCSTIAPKVSRSLGQLANSATTGHRFVDAPVSGGVVGAKAATLTFMVGAATAADLQAATPTLRQMGARVVACGPVGNGQIAKLCNNLILASTMCATAEGLNLGVKMGVDAKVLTDIVNTSSGRSWSSEVYNPVPGIVANLPAADDYSGGFSCRLLAKDLTLAAEIGSDAGVPLLLTAVTQQIYRALVANGYGEKDFAVVYKLLKGTDDQ